MPEKIPPEEAEALVEALSYQDRIRILANVLWDVFGDVDEDGENVLVPGRTPDRIDIKSLVTSLTQEFWPEDEPDTEGDDRSCPHDNLISYTEDGTHYRACRDCGAIWLD